MRSATGHVIRPVPLIAAPFAPVFRASPDAIGAMHAHFEAHSPMLSETLPSQPDARIPRRTVATKGLAFLPPARPAMNAAPCPLFGRSYQSSFHGIRVDVLHFAGKLRNITGVPIEPAALQPEPHGPVGSCDPREDRCVEFTPPRNHPLRDAHFESPERSGQGYPVARHRDYMDMLWHDDICEQFEPKPLFRIEERLADEIADRRRSQQAQPVFA